ncbi:MAG: nuclear transport factor 2 family protein [Reichenbachiella sp.]|uniref:nuclear transport factor 2 family protein n=1 Tax=Reichenbachiella sp. TaxID=2184521 RepID=UPI003266575B
MNINEIAEKLAAYCREGNWSGAQEALYAENAVSLEPAGAPNERTEGLEAIKKKGEDFDKMIEKVHSVKISEPLVADRFFTLTTFMEADFIGMGKITMEEVCVYEVADGKIVKEQFFYTPAPQG